MADSQGKTVMAIGRIVWVAGDLFKGSPKLDFNTKAPKVDSMGNPMMEYGFGLAVSKQPSQGNPGISEIWPALYEEAYTLYPSRQLPPAFALKYKDGDTDIDDKGVPFNQRKGYPGSVVFACKTSLPIKFFRHENGQNVMINDGIKCGDYVQVQLSIKAHGAVGQGKPGMYLNPNAVLFLGYGEPIVNQPSGDQIFGAPPPMPQGASATPFAPPGGFAMPPVAPPVYGQPATPQWGQAIGQAPVAPPAPHYGVLPPQHQPAPQAAPPMPGYPQAPAAPQFAAPAPQFPYTQNTAAQPGGGMPPMPGAPR